jgi:hypothetical protein
VSHSVIHDLYLVACNADDLFHAELVRVHGRKAAEFRYTPELDTDPALIAARAAKYAADNAWQAEIDSRSRIFSRSNSGAL